MEFVVTNISTGIGMPTASVQLQQVVEPGTPNSSLTLNVTLAEAADYEIGTSYQMTLTPSA